VFIFFGYWFRTKSVRLSLIMGLLLAAFIVTPIAVGSATNALGWGEPLIFQYVAQGLMAAAITGWLVMTIRR